MNKFISAIILISLSINISFGSTKKLYSNEQLEALNTDLNAKLNSNLAAYLGEIKFSVFLKLNSKMVKTKANKKVEMQSIYLLDTPSLTENVSIEENMVENAEIKVVIYESLNDSINKEVEEIAKSTLDPIVSTVKISYLESTRLFYDKAANESKDLFSFIKGVLNRNIPEVLRLIGVLIFAIVAVFGVVIFARLLKGPLNSIAESLKNFSKASVATANKNDEKDKEEEVVDHKEISEKFKENIIVFKSIILDRPLDIADLILSDEINASGVKKLLPYLYEKKYSDVIKENFKEIHFAQMGMAKNSFNTNVEFFNWFEETIQTLSLKILNKNKNVLLSVSEEKLDELKKVPHTLFKSYLQSTGSSIAYQVVMDVLAGEEKAEFLKELDLEEWKIAFDVKDISESEINTEIDSILDYSKSTLRNDDSISANEINSTLVIPSLLGVVAFKKLKVQDDFLDSLAMISKESIQAVRDVYWTPRDVLSVPQAYLKECMRGYDVSEKTMIIHSMPIDIANFLLSSSIEGKAKEIVIDSLENKGSDFNEEKAEQLGAKFIKNLLVAFKKGEFKLNEFAKTLETKAPSLEIVAKSSEDDLDLGSDEDFDLGSDDLDSGTDSDLDKDEAA
jgi:hypothetical protein